MTDNEIIEALECCSTYKGKCTDCPAFIKVDRSNCKQVLLGAIEIINRQKAENENHKTAFKESITDMLSEYSNVLVSKMLLAKEHTLNNPNKEDSLEYIRGKAEAFETAIKLIDKALEEMVGWRNES